MSVTHPDYGGRVTIAGKDGSDAKRYLENEVKQAIAEIKRKRQDG
jgi:hypothetical protein